MRRTFLVLLGLVSTMATLVATPPAAQAISAPTGLKTQGDKAFEALLVGWNWGAAARSYVLQISEEKSFGDADRVKVAAKASRPASGRQAYRFTGLTDGTRYYVRVAAIAPDGRRSGWSSRIDGETRTRHPSAPDGPVKAVSGPGPGEVTFTWATKGHHTDLFKIETATSPFKSGARDHTVFKIDPDLRRYTLSAAQTEKATAGIGTAWTLVWRFRAVNEGTAGNQERYFGQGQSRVPGRPPAGEGERIRVASYNIRNDNLVGPAELTWDKRVPRIVDMIKKHDPGIVLLQELFADMVDKFQATMSSRNLTEYKLNRSTPLKTGADGERKLQNRLLYDATRYSMVSNCPTDVDDTACHFSFPAVGGPDYVPYARMRDLASGQEFYILSFHLPQGPEFEDLRREAMRVIVEKLEKINVEGLPVIIGGDSNSSQLRQGVRPHDILMQHGFYDAASAVEHVNPEYGTHNDFAYQTPSGFGISPRIDLIATQGMPGSAKFANVVIPRGDPFPSDHNMIYADLRLP